jgi:hypothetical protein
MTPRILISTAVSLAALGAAAGPAVAVAGEHSAEYLPSIKAPAATPTAIHGSEPKAVLAKGDKLGKGQYLLRVRVSGPARKGTQLKLTCSSGGFVTGYGYRGPDALAVNGRPILGRHTVRPKVQAASDRNGDGRFTGIVFALCEAGRAS